MTASSLLALRRCLILLARMSAKTGSCRSMIRLSLKSSAIRTPLGDKWSFGEDMPTSFPRLESGQRQRDLRGQIGHRKAGRTTTSSAILSGGHPRAKAPLVLGNEGAGVIEDAGDSGLTVGSRVMVHGAL